MLSRVPLIAVGLVVLAPPQSGNAQSDADGLWLALGFGPGASYARTWDAGVSPKSGTFGYLEIGRKVSEDVGVGLGLTGWVGTAAGIKDLIRGTWGPTLHWFPIHNRDLSFHAGVGLALANTGFQGPRDKGIGANAGVRYGVHIIGGLVFQPSIDWILQRVDFGPGIARVGQAWGFTLGLGWH